MSIYSFIKSHAVAAGTVTVLVVAGMVIGGRVATRNKTTANNESNIKKVKLVDAASFKNGQTTVAADGTVESVSQVDLKSQLSAPLKVVNVSIGETVSEGEVIAELQNEDIRAQLEQARSTLEIARGQYSTGSLSIDNARRSAMNTIRDSYEKARDAVFTSMDGFIQNNVSGVPIFYSFLTDEKINSKIRDDRARLIPIFTAWESAVNKLSESSTDVEVQSVLSLSEKNIIAVSTLLNDVASALSTIAQNVNGANLSYITTWQTTTIAAKSSVSTATSNLTTADTTLSNALLSHVGAGNAQVAQAEAGVKNLEAQLAKTIITSPISGKIAALPLRSGELASPGQLIATVVGGGGLQIRAYVSGEDLARIKAGAKATIASTIPGTVVSVAPSVNQTNKKVEVKVAVLGPNTLVVGQDVSVAIEAVNKGVTATNASLYLVPIQNVKIVPGSASVFTVDENSRIVAHPVMLGKVEGNYVEIISGLSDTMKIVSPVYEIEVGEKVNVE